MEVEEEVDYDFVSPTKTDQQLEAQQPEALDELYTGLLPSAAERDAAADAEVQELRGSVAALTQKVEMLEKQKDILTRNISCLYNTAVEENKRKDAIIKDLRMQQFQAAAKARAAQTAAGAP